MDQPDHRLDQNERAQPEQQHGVGDGGQDLGPQVAEGADVARGAGGEVHRQQRQPDARRVSGHMPGVGDEDEGVGQHAADDLRRQDGQRDAEHEPEPAPLFTCGGSRLAVVVAHVRDAPSRPYRGTAGLFQVTAPPVISRCLRRSGWRPGGPQNGC